ncbi:hypothetical protein PT279_02280 [Bifidobacterium sp. ESL0784]|uniref:hypothetical protein n=1 Tax=Bifidobacterium sp. ESL0784 TaxID=2983231 RepID=UPI0023F9AE74|nr:hypothetical protein [Bifidobacterium sp. ESL0784]MDF7640424.1 hypothetical protein [Bifidobacterium sp. ESL0784]
MKINSRLTELLSHAEAQHRCLHACEHRDQQRLRALVESGEVTRPWHGLYVRTAIWQELDPSEQYLWIIRALHDWHPEWNFAGISAISVYGIEHPYWLHDHKEVFLATAKSMSSRKAKGVRYIHVPEVVTVQSSHISITSAARSLCDCAARYEFHEVLPMFDSAMRKKLVNEQAIIKASANVRVADSKIQSLLRFADWHSENCGESVCRAIMLEEGFGRPNLQNEFRIPTANGDMLTYRVDMTYRLPNNRLIGVEFDGMDKYVNPDMTNHRSIRQVVHEEKERERNLLTATPIKRIVRLDFIDIMQRTRLIQKLSDAGVPRNFEYKR